MRPGELFWAPFPFTDTEDVKRRPACVVSGEAFNRGPDLILAMLTSRRALLTAPGVGDVPLTDWRSASLLAPSTLRAGRLQTMASGLLMGRLGTLSPADLDALKHALRDVLELTS